MPCFFLLLPTTPLLLPLLVQIETPTVQLQFTIDEKLPEIVLLLATVEQYSPTFA